MGDDWRASGDVAASGTITHDGESDVLVSFIHENGDETELIWIWDPPCTLSSLASLSSLSRYLPRFFQ